MRDNLSNLSQSIQSELIPKPVPPTADWVEAEFRLPPEARGSDTDSRYSFQAVPYILGIYAAMDDPDVQEVVVQKAAQVGWTYAFIAWLFKIIALVPCAIVGMFAKDGAAREFNDEKLEPSIRATPSLNRIIDVTKSRSSSNRALFKSFPNGFLKLVGSKSISSVKSTTARFVFVEEPDDSADNLKEQGNAIKLLWERTKRMRNSKRILGGTPSVEGLSKVEDHIRISDQRVLPIRCHACDAFNVLDWDNVNYTESDDPGYQPHEVYGRYLPETAAYACPECGELWDDHRRKQNIRETVFDAIAAGDRFCGWTPTAPFHGIAGFKELSELYSCLPGAGLSDLVKDYLSAEFEASRGDETERIVFQNSKLARTYAYEGDHVTADALRDKADDYPEGTVPAGGLMLTVGIDVQQNPARVSVLHRAWGRGEENWAVVWQELHAQNSTADKSDQVWDDLERVVFQAYPHVTGAAMYASAVSIDSSDGTTNDAVYDWVRRMSKKYPHVLVMAIKGSSSQQDPEIFSTPRVKGVDHANPKKQSKADRFGLKIYIVGTNKAKDWLSGHMKLDGEGPGRCHVYKTVRQDYFEQVTGEVKAPHRTLRNKKTWQKKSGRAVEAWDCEVYALHAARARRVHLKSPADWDVLEQQLLQADMFRESAPVHVETEAVPDPDPQVEKPAAEVADQEVQHVRTPEPARKAERRSMADIGRRFRGH